MTSRLKPNASIDVVGNTVYIDTDDQILMDDIEFWLRHGVKGGVVYRHQKGVRYITNKEGLEQILYTFNKRYGHCE